MRYILAVLAVAMIVQPGFAANHRQSESDVYVHGYEKSNGTYVEPSYRSAPNANNWDNYNYKPTEPAYNAPRENASPSWNTPNAGRLNDENPNNDAPANNWYRR